MRGLKNNAPIDFYINNMLKTPISIGVICPKGHDKEFFDFINKLNNQSTVKYNMDYVIPFTGFYEVFKTGINIPSNDSNKLASFLPPNKSDTHKAVIAFGNIIVRNLEQINACSVE